MLISLNVLPQRRPGSMRVRPAPTPFSLAPSSVPVSFPRLLFARESAFVATTTLDSRESRAERETTRSLTTRMTTRPRPLARTFLAFAFFVQRHGSESRRATHVSQEEIKETVEPRRSVFSRARVKIHTNCHSLAWCCFSRERC